MRRAKLYYMRELSGKAARIREKLTVKPTAEAKEAAAKAKASVVDITPDKTEE